MEYSQVSVIGLGYIGLPTAVLLASAETKVVGVDINEAIVKSVNQGILHFSEPGLQELLKNKVESGFLRATTRVENCDAYIIAVPTPISESNAPDLSYVKDATRSIAPVLKKGDVVILESTSPVGTTEAMAHWLAEARPDLSFPEIAGCNADIKIAFCPERVVPGNIIKELIENDRIIGGISQSCSEAAKALYGIFVTGECYTTSVRTAELCKLAENSFRDVNIAFANELSMICHAYDIDSTELIRLANKHPRVNILTPGCGVGGHCIAVDPWFIIKSLPEETALLQAARMVNIKKMNWVSARIEQAIAKLVARGLSRDLIRIACLGLTYKKNSDDFRESPALAICKNLDLKYNKQVIAVEPSISQNSHILNGTNIALVDLETALQADIVVLLVAHDIFNNMHGFDREVQFVIDTTGTLG